jgi:zinc protease
VKLIASIILLNFLSPLTYASFVKDVQKTKWNDLDVVWVEDEKFPRFTASFYFQDGALSDDFSGLTQATFDLLTAGTSTQNQKEIAQFFDFYGAKLKHSVTHEYSVLSLSGLTKDIQPLVGKVCELFKDAQYPASELNSYVSRSKGHLKNLVTSHASLADRVFRQISLGGSSYEVPVEGTLTSFDKITKDKLIQRLKALSATKKILYVSGPAEVKKIKSTISENCNWKSNQNLSSRDLKKPSSQSVIYLVPVPGANQAQIRIGRLMNREELKGKIDNFHFLAAFLGGGFTSKLVQELRVKRGLTYSASAYVSVQKDYGRAGVSTFSKTETAAETISIIRDIFEELASNKISDKEFNHQKGNTIGGFAFGFEETSAFLGQLMLYEHQGRRIDDLEKFPENIQKLKQAELSQAGLEAFPWNRMTILVVGDKALEKTLSKIRPVRVINYEDYL